jgi:hypothetical protein
MQKNGQTLRIIRVRSTDVKEDVTRLALKQSTPLVVRNITIMLIL